MSSLLEKEPTIIGASLLSSSSIHEYFRARDVLLQIDLFSKQLQTDAYGEEIEVQVTQVARILEGLIKKNMASKETSSKPIYRIKPEGFLNILEIFTSPWKRLSTESAIFTKYFIDSYHSIIIKTLIDRYPDEKITIEKIEKILCGDKIFQNQIKLINNAITDIEKRILDSNKLISWLQEEKIDLKNPRDVAAKIPSNFSWQLGYRKSLKEWMIELPDLVLSHELRTGISNRQKYFYKHQLEMLNLQKKFYENRIN